MPSTPCLTAAAVWCWGSWLFEDNCLFVFRSPRLWESKREPARPQDDRRARQSRILVSRLTQGNLAFPVEEVGAIHRYNPVDLQPAPSTLARASIMRGVLRWQDKSVGCLDEDLLFTTLSRNLI